MNHAPDTFRRFDNMSKKENDEEGFFSDSFSVLFNPHKFVFDFKQSTPKVSTKKDGRKVESVVWHRPIIVDPILAKKMLTVLQKNVEKYEDRFGEIEINGKEQKDDVEADEADEPTYIG